jgi:hypothetical protein
MRIDFGNLPSYDRVHHGHVERKTFTERQNNGLCRVMEVSLYILFGIALSLGLLSVLSTIAWGRVRRVDKDNRQMATHWDQYW